MRAFRLPAGPGAGGTAAGGGGGGGGGWPSPAAAPAAPAGAPAPGRGWLAHCAAPASPPGSAGRFFSSGSSARTEKTRIAAAVRTPSSAQMEKSKSNVSNQANSVRRKPSAARPTVTHERGKPTLRSVNAGSSAHTDARRKRKKAVLTLPDVQPLMPTPKNWNQEKKLRTRNSTVPPAMT